MRLRASGDYRRVHAGGRRVRQACFTLIYAPGTGPGSRFGMAVSRKVGNAVVRNRVKRWLREAMRHERSSLDGCWDVVIVARPSAAEAGAVELAAQVRRAFGRIGGRHP